MCVCLHVDVTRFGFSSPHYLSTAIARESASSGVSARAHGRPSGCVHATAKKRSFIVHNTNSSDSYYYNFLACSSCHFLGSLQPCVVGVVGLYRSATKVRAQGTRVDPAVI